MAAPVTRTIPWGLLALYRRASGNKRHYWPASCVAWHIRDWPNGGWRFIRTYMHHTDWLTAPSIKQSGRYPVSRHQIQPECGEQAGWQGAGRPNPGVSQDQILRRDRRQGNKYFPVQLPPRHWQPYPVDPAYSAFFAIFFSHRLIQPKTNQSQAGASEDMMGLFI